MAEKNDLKVEGNKVMWFNGKTWLVRETCKNHAKAMQLLNELHGNS